MKSLKKRLWRPKDSKDNLWKKDDDTESSSPDPMSAVEPHLDVDCSSAIAKSDLDVSRDPAFENNFDSVPFIDGTSRNVADAVCQTDSMFLPQAEYLQQPSCLSSEVFSASLSNPIRESCETDIPNSSPAVYWNHSDLHLQSELVEKFAHLHPSQKETQLLSL